MLNPTLLADIDIYMHFMSVSAILFSLIYISIRISLLFDHMHISTCTK